jgi:general stress protein YciG
MTKKRKKMSMAEAGRIGGMTTKKRHGIEHFRAIGRKGFQATCDRHHEGDRRAMLNELIKRGLATMDPSPWNGAWQDYNAFPARAKEPEALPEDEDPVIAQILRSIQSAPIPEGGGL